MFVPGLIFSPIAAGYAAQTNAAQTTAGVLAHGQYLTHGAGQCGDCHGASLSGGPTMFPGPPGVPWAKSAPSLRGLPMFAKDSDAITFFETAKLPDGHGALGPMPTYHFDHADAVSIVAYLRSLE